MHNRARVGTPVKQWDLHLIALIYGDAHDVDYMTRETRKGSSTLLSVSKPATTKLP